MILHVGIQVKSDDVEPFYVETLGGTMVNKFQIQSETSEQVFRIPARTEVQFVALPSLQLELFIHSSAIPPTYNHICLAVENAPDIFEKAGIRGFKTLSRMSAGHETYFIYDHNNNIFELKNSTHE